MEHLSFTYSIWGTIYQLSFPHVHVNSFLPFPQHLDLMMHVNLKSEPARDLRHGVNSMLRNT